MLIVPIEVNVVPAHPYPGEELEVLPGCQLVEKDIVLRADASHLAYLFHVVGVSDVVADQDDQW